MLHCVSKNQMCTVKDVDLEAMPTSIFLNDDDDDVMMTTN